MVDMTLLMSPAPTAPSHVDPYAYYLCLPEASHRSAVTNYSPKRPCCALTPLLPPARKPATVAMSKARCARWRELLQLTNAIVGLELCAVRPAKRRCFLPDQSPATLMTSVTVTAGMLQTWSCSWKPGFWLHFRTDSTGQGRHSPSVGSWKKAFNRLKCSSEEQRESDQASIPLLTA